MYNCAQIGKGEYLIWEGEELWPILKGQRKWKLVGHSWSHVCWHHAVSFLVKISKSILQTVCFSFNSWLFEVLSLINLWLNLKLKNEMIRDSHHESLNPEKINQSRLREHLVSFWVTRSWAQATKKHPSIASSDFDWTRLASNCEALLHLHYPLSSRLHWGALRQMWIVIKCKARPLDHRCY